MSSAARSRRRLCEALSVQSRRDRTSIMLVLHKSWINFGVSIEAYSKRMIARLLSEKPIFHKAREGPNLSADYLTAETTVVALANN